MKCERRTKPSAALAFRSPPRSALIGRAQDVETVRELLLRGARLLTLIGPPGVGKTRLALEAAEGLRPRFEQGVCVVELAATTDPARVLDVIADAVGLAGASVGAGAEDLLIALTGALASRRMLLVLDNFEHVLAAAPSVGALLDSCPRLAVLVTSRAPLRLSDEREFPVSPLSLPPPVVEGAPPSPEEVASSDAARLFVQRAQLVRPGFGIGRHNAAGIAALCRALDGLPLAIELAAARVRVLAPDEMAQQMAGRLSLLSRGRRDAPQRHRTLHAAIDWSHGLLTPDEQRLFRRLAVFSGGFDSEAATAVWDAPGRAAESRDEADEVVDLLDALAEQSLLAMDQASSRLSMLELVRAYALERLRAAGEEEPVRWRHARYYVELAAGAEPLLKSRHQSQWVRRLAAEHANLRAALGWLLERARLGNGERADAAELGLRLAGSLWWFWHLTGHNAEGREWLAAFLDLPAAQAPTGGRARTLFGAGFLAWSSRFWAWEPESSAASARLQEEALAIFRALGDRRGEAYALWGLGLTMYGADLERQAQILSEALAVFREVGDLWGIVKSLEHLSNVMHWQKRWDDVRALLEEGNAVARQLGEPQSLLSNLRQLGDASLRQGDVALAREYYVESFEVLEESGLLSPRSLTHHALGRLAMAEGDFSTAAARFLESFRAAQLLGSRTYGGDAVMGLAAATARDGEPERGLRLVGAASRYRQPGAPQRGTPTVPPPPSPGALAAFVRDVERYWPLFTRARDTVGETRTMALLREGARTPIEHLLADAAVAAPLPLMTPPRAANGKRPALPAPSGAPPSPDALAPLTPREAETAALIARGLTNREIAQRLTITERTVMRHVEHILSKLALRSRTQIAVWVVERSPRADAPQVK